jgi:multicomponent Na+:H+ antiporter subunit B
MKRKLQLLAETALLVLVGAFLFLSLRGEHPGNSLIREHVIENGSRETGAMNLVASIYLGYRAFDTLGETIVLLLAVSGVLYFTEPGK